MWSELNSEQRKAQDWAREVEIISPLHVYMYTAASTSFLWTCMYCSVVRYRLQNNTELIAVMILCLHSKLLIWAPLDLQVQTEAHSTGTFVSSLFIQSSSW
jgi:hypothetical protein